MRVVFIHGRAAAGKFTIATELARFSGYALFHNHLTVNLLRSVFPFGSEAFVKHRERIWLDVMGDAAEAGTNLIFTFNPEKTVSPDFPRRLEKRVEQAGGSVVFVEVVCPEIEIENRLDAVSRQDWEKLSSVPLYRQLSEEGQFDYPSLRADLTVDSGVLSPAEAARRIVDFLGLPEGAR